jgi:ribose transport system permease protein
VAVVNSLASGLGSVRARVSARGGGRGHDSLVSRFGLLVLTGALILIFTILLPSTFPTLLDLRSIISGNSVDAILALASMIPITLGKFDISVGYALGLSEVLAITLQSEAHLPWGLVIVVVLLLGSFIGTVNGFLVEFAQIDSFIATLGTGYVLYGLMLWVTGGNEILATLPKTFVSLGTGAIGSVPYSLFYVLGVALVLWVVLEYLPAGRYMYAAGSNRRAAQLNGIAVQRCVVGAFVASGFLAAGAGVVLAAQIGIGEPSIGNNYLLPALVGALLGTTALRPGRANAWGTIVAVVILAVGITGLEQEGAQFFVDPLFDGATLLIAVGIAGVTARRRQRGRLSVARVSQGGEGQAELSDTASGSEAQGLQNHIGTSAE